MPLSAAELDRIDPLAHLRSHFQFPADSTYFDGNSLGLLSERAEESVLETLEQWKQLGVEGWTRAKPDWFGLVETIAVQLEAIVNAPKTSISLIGSTTLELHQILGTLYRPDDSRSGILMDGLAFPTDRYAISSFLSLTGRPDRCLKEVPAGEHGWLEEQRIIEAFQQDVQLAVLPSVVYTTGQLLDLERITKAAQDADVRVCWDCSHSVGVVPLDLGQLQPDAAIWCTYKYLNGGPGSVAALYLHPRWNHLPPGMAGWFGCEKSRQFEMSREFLPAEGTGRLQLGTPHILSLAALRGSLEIFESVSVCELRQKSLSMTQLLIDRIKRDLGSFGVELVTPEEDHRRGGHLALRYPQARGLARLLRTRGFIPDFRGPDLIRLAPNPLYNRFIDCDRVVEEMQNILGSGEDALNDADGELVH